MTTRYYETGQPFKALSIASLAACFITKYKQSNTEQYNMKTYSQLFIDNLFIREIWDTNPI